MLPRHLMSSAAAVGCSLRMSTRLHGSPFAMHSFSEALHAALRLRCVVGDAFSHYIRRAQGHPHNTAFRYLSGGAAVHVHAAKMDTEIDDSISSG